VIAWRSLAFRLTAAYTVMLLLGYAAFGLALWWSVRSVLLSSADQLLSTRLDRLVQAVNADVNADPPELDPIADMEDNLIDLLKASPEGHLSQVRRADGRQVFPPEGSLSPDVPWSGLLLEPKQRTVAIETAPYRLLARDVSLAGHNYRILLASSLESRETVREGLARSFLIATPLALALSGLLGWSIAGRALRPIDKVASAAGEINSRRLSRRIEIPATGDALERLSRTFNQMLDRLEASFTRVEQFSADASHELRTPLSVIRTTAELALKHGGSEEGYRRDLLSIQSESERLSHLVEVLLTLARQDTGAESIQMAEVDVGGLVLNVCQRFEPSAQRKGLELRTDIPGPSHVLVANEPSLRQIIYCLLENALAHTEAGRITVSVSHQGLLQVTVTDTGEGIPEDALEKIFDRFYRVDAARSREGGHLGLGLSIARRIAELHRATLTAKSRLGEGSSFILRFPPFGSEEEH
jgi:heavy metal sensor kinase